MRKGVEVCYPADQREENRVQQSPDKTFRREDGGSLVGGCEHVDVVEFIRTLALYKSYWYPLINPYNFFMRKILSLVPFIFLGTVVFALSASASFTDSEAYEFPYNTGWYFKAADYLQENGIVDGYPDGSFLPLNTINRAEFTKIVMNATHPEAVTGTDCFTDVADEWYSPYVCGAKTLGVIDGYDDGSFKPGNHINFAEAAKILTNAFNIPTEPNEEMWYKPYSDYMLENHYLPMTTPGVSFSVNRGEMAEMVYNFLTQDPMYSSYVNPYNEAFGGKDIVRIGDGGSCFFYEVQDLDRNSIPVSDELEEIFTCGSDVKFFSTDGRYLYYIKTNLKVYDFEDQSTTTLVSLYDTTENVSSIARNEAGNWFAMAVLNFEATDYPTGVKLFVLNIEGETVVSKEKYDIKSPYSCAADQGCFLLESPEWNANGDIEYFECEDQAADGWGYDYPWTIEDLSTVQGCELKVLDR